MKLKLDLHTHIGEAFNFQPPTPAMVEKVLAQAKRRGLDGFAITDHHDHEWGRAFKRLADEHFPGQMVIIPGWEIEVRPSASPFDEYQVSELFLPEGGVFRIYCHPGYYTPRIVIQDTVHAIEIDNYLHNWHIRKPQVAEVARQLDLLTVSVSDAHDIEKLGLRHTEIELAELYRRAEK